MTEPNTTTLPPTERIPLAYGTLRWLGFPATADMLLSYTAEIAVKQHPALAEKLQSLADEADRLVAALTTPSVQAARSAGALPIVWQQVHDAAGAEPRPTIRVEDYDSARGVAYGREGLLPSSLQPTGIVTGLSDKGFEIRGGEPLRVERFEWPEVVAVHVIGQEGVPNA